MSALFGREEVERREQAILAPYAALAAESRGRVYAQWEHPLRTVFQRDRDRLIHSAAFRRMEYKTQVFIPHEQDHFRTRLTHTMEVAQIARTMARNLRLNEDLAEAIALAHDLGHTPFGHAGEHALDRLLADRGGFNHNRQSLRVVDVLEERYPDHPGLNLSYEVREGIAKHETSVKLELPEFDGHLRPTLEASLVDIADEIAYNTHDIDDGVSSGLITFDEIAACDCVKELAGEQLDAVLQFDPDRRRYALARTLINRLATDVLNETSAKLERFEISDLSAVRSCSEKLVAYSSDVAQAVKALKRLLKERLYDHPELVRMTERAGRILSDLYARFTSEPGSMPPRFGRMLETEPLEVVVADYIAGMTDRFAEKVWGKGD